jgi:hypothetical protein
MIRRKSDRGATFASFRRHALSRIRSLSSSPSPRPARPMARVLGHAVARALAAGRMVAQDDARVRTLLSRPASHPTDAVAARLAVLASSRDPLSRSRARRGLRAVRRRARPARQRMARAHGARRLSCARPYSGCRAPFRHEGRTRALPASLPGLRSCTRSAASDARVALPGLRDVGPRRPARDPSRPRGRAATSGGRDRLARSVRRAAPAAHDVEAAQLRVFVFSGRRADLAMQSASGRGIAGMRAGRCA